MEHGTWTKVSGQWCVVMPKPVAVGSRVLVFAKKSKSWSEKQVTGTRASTKHGSVYTVESVEDTGPPTTLAVPSLNSDAVADLRKQLMELVESKMTELLKSVFDLPSTKKLGLRTWVEKGPTAPVKAEQRKRSIKDEPKRKPPAILRTCNDEIMTVAHVCEMPDGSASVSLIDQAGKRCSYRTTQRNPVSKFRGAHVVVARGEITKSQHGGERRLRRAEIQPAFGN